MNRKKTFVWRIYLDEQQPWHVLCFGGIAIAAKHPRLLSEHELEHLRFVSFVLPKGGEGNECKSQHCLWGVMRARFVLFFPILPMLKRL
jgi:hypothetical protein